MNEVTSMNETTFVKKVLNILYDLKLINDDTVKAIQNIDKSAKLDIMNILNDADAQAITPIS
jgi:hypothetical protein